MCRVSKAVSVAPAKGDIAWSQTGITGGIGAAVSGGSMAGAEDTTPSNAANPYVIVDFIVVSVDLREA